MAEQQTFDDLTPEQQAQLTALLEKLGSFPVSERIVRCEEAIGDSTSEADRIRIDAALAAAWAYSRMLLYLERLRRLNDERMEIGNQIRSLPRFPSPKSNEEADLEAHARVYGPHLAGQQEIVLNFFTVSIQHIHSLLKVVAEAVGYEIDPDDEAFFQKFRPLRNHFEHWYSRLPGTTGEIGLVTKTVTAYGYQVRGGLERGPNDTVIVVEPTKPIAIAHIVEANNDGVARVERIVQEANARFLELPVERVREHYINDPTNIPPPESVSDDLLFSVQGFGP
jgi:hypothetical protein